MASLQDIDVLEQLFVRGLIPAEEYSIRRVQLINRLTNTVYSPTSGPEISTPALLLSTSSNPSLPAAEIPFRPQPGSPFGETSPKSPSVEVKSDSISLSAPVNPGGSFGSMSLSAVTAAPPMTRVAAAQNIALPPIEFITNMSQIDPLKSSIFGPTGGPFAQTHGAVPLPMPPGPTHMNITTFHPPLPHTNGFRTSSLPFSGPRLANDLRFSESSSISSEEESSDSDARKSRSKRRLDQISAATLANGDKSAQDPLPDDNSSASKRTKTSESEDIALASLAAIASSSSSSESNQNMIAKLRSELSDSHAAIHDAHAALHGYVVRDEERRARVNMVLPPQFPPYGAFPTHSPGPNAWNPQQFMGTLMPPPTMQMDPLLPNRFQAPPGFSPMPQNLRAAAPRPSQAIQKPIFRLEITAQPPNKVVYQRILKPFPQLSVVFIPDDNNSPDASPPPSLWNNLYVEASLQRSDTHDAITHVDGGTMVRVWNGVATFRKLKIMSTTQQIGSPLVISFSLKHFEGNEFKTLSCPNIISTSIEVFSHSQYLKGSNAKDKEKEIRQTLQNNVSEEQSAAEAQHHKDRFSSTDSATSSGSPSTRQGSPSDSPPNEREPELSASGGNTPGVGSSPSSVSLSHRKSTACASEVTAKDAGDVKGEPLQEISVAAGES